MIKYDGEKVKLVKWLLKGVNDPTAKDKKKKIDWVQAEYVDGQRELCRFPVPTDELQGSALHDELKTLPKMLGE